VRNTVGALMDAALAPPISWEDVPPDQTTLPKQLANAEAARLVSLFVVDRSDAAKAPWQQMLTTIDQSGQRNIAVLVGWKASEIGAPADVKNALQQLLPSGIFADYFPLDDEQAFKETVKRAIATVRMPMIASDDAKKVVAPEIRDEAVGKGIPVDSISTLPSPGATS
jgi:hypothetical protein